MRKTLVVLILFSISLLACNLSVAQPTAKSDSIATAVARTLSSKPSQTAQPQSTASLTSLASLTPTLTQTAVPSQTLTTSPSTTISPSATLSSTDPKKSLGAPTYTDTLTTGKGWYQTSDDHTIIAAQNGALVLTSIQPVSWYSWSLNFRKVTNFYLEAVLHVNNCSGSDRYGLVFRAPDTTQGYFYGLTCDGHYGLSSFDGSSFHTIIANTSSNLILSGSNQTNRVGVMARGDALTLYVNGDKLKEVQDSTYTGEGTYGVFIAGQQTPNFTIELDEISHWVLQ
jgi:hypothetical protein